MNQSDKLMQVVKKKNARQFLEDEVAPILLPALVQMKHAKPVNPVEWLADWLTLHDAAIQK
jgi:Dpy-30 motif